MTEWTKRMAALALTLLAVTLLLHLNLRTGADGAQAPMLVSFLGECLVWLVLSAILMSFIEHQIHQHLMHRRNFLSKRRASFQRVFEAHAIVHHQQHYSKEFCDEPVPAGTDKEIRLTVRKAPIKALPIAILIAFMSLPGAIIFLAVVTIHHWVWNKIHLEMHKPEGKWFGSWPAYKFLARHHYLHHRHQDKNFNVVFPFADYVLGTNARASDSDRVEMSRLGLL